MIKTAKINKFDLWKEENIDLYYALKDLCLYLDCLQSSYEKTIEIIRQKDKKQLKNENLKKIINSIKNKIEETKEIFKEIEKI